VLALQLSQVLTLQLLEAGVSHQLLIGCAHTAELQYSNICVAEGRWGDSGEHNPTYRVTMKTAEL
jgi:hypothetical protein